MRINVDRLRPAPMPLKGFMGNIVQPMGAITLFVMAGKVPRTSTKMADFLVIKAPSLYKAILGCLTLNNLRAVTSTYHFKMKFPTNLGVRKVHEEQVLARDCCTRDLKHEVKEVEMIRELGEAVGPPSLPDLAEWNEEVLDEGRAKRALGAGLD